MLPLLRIALSRHASLIAIETLVPCLIPPPLHQFRNVVHRFIHQLHRSSKQDRKCPRLQDQLSQYNLRHDHNNDSGRSELRPLCQRTKCHFRTPQLLQPLPTSSRSAPRSPRSPTPIPPNRHSAGQIIRKDKATEVIITGTKVKVLSRVRTTLGKVVHIERRILRDVTLVQTGADAHVCLRIEKNRHRRVQPVQRR